MREGNVLNVYLACVYFQGGKLGVIFNRLSTFALSSVFSALRDISDLGAIGFISPINEFYH